MKTSALYCISGAAPWLELSFESIYGVVDAIYFFLSSRTWQGEASDNSALLERVARLDDANGKIKIIQSEWANEKDQRNASLAHAQLDGFSLALIIDSDEIYDSEQLKAAIDFAKTSAADCFHIKWLTYWKTLGWRIDPIEPYDPVVLVKLGKVGFIETRNPVGERHILIQPQIAICHHLSYVLSNLELRSKHIMKKGHSQSCHKDWYEKVWLAWDDNPSLENLHPVTPHFFKKAVSHPPQFLPPVLIKFLGA